MRDCPVCCVPFLPASFRQKYCSIKCRHHNGYVLMVERDKTRRMRTAECGWCGHEFSRMSFHKQNMKACSDTCKRWLIASYGGERALICKITVPRSCAHCGELFVSTSFGAVVCSAECRTEREAEMHGRRNRTCGDCGASLGVFSLVTYCDECRDKRARTNQREGSRASKHRRRALMHGAEYERINTSLIYERDAWRCGVCGKRVNKALTYPHRMSASLDHIVPLAHGGTHTKANVQLAHWICNCKKSDKLDVQPLLFG